MLQRLVTAAAVMCGGITHLHATISYGSIFPQIIEVGAGAFLLVGLWTPLIGGVIAGREMWVALSGSGDLWLHLVLASLGASLAIIGPGAWSIDAHLFGRKQIKVSSR